ncbi:flagellar protein MotX [Candidatus Enterovibrio altilux]|uniref:Sodium-type flagellar protein MotX n=1 Tax=Candidatus Enterovibrio altilux TaxID=1927128 RepID=A0A291B8L1_9GAMM|nr:tetratricopeptide repeat protein [Candidatus Enterovibrio luxaltus]ATF09346.1 Sodium-type flagellar protein MotX [Candidatus Enterovibrio luxaltus]
MELRILFISIMLASSATKADIGPALPVYENSQLFRLFETNSHLKKVKADECQLLQDIEARVIRIESPSYQFLYGDMLAWGVCVERDAAQGVYYMQLAAQQGLPAALEQLGRYYSRGTLVQQDTERAIFYLREAASLGNTRAKLQLAELLVADYGSPLDYEDAYRWLYQTITTDSSTHQKVTMLRKSLENKMPRNVIARAKRHDTFW